MLRKALLIGTTLGFATILSMGISNAQDQAPAPDQKQMHRDAQGNECTTAEDCGLSGDSNRKERRARSRDDDNDDNRRARSRDDDDDKVGSNDGDQDTRRSKERREASNRNWRYDPQRHRRSRDRDATFRFYFGGYYYPERYWDAPVVVIGNRVSCREGREIVDDSGFNRVRTVECSGRNYTYMGRRHGDTFRIVLNSRNGRIVSVREF
jgi:hypothetical protein